MKESKHKIVIGCEVLLLCMMIGVLGTKAASSNPPSNGVSYNKNSQTTVEGALNDLYDKANYGNASAGDILSGKTALVGGKKVTGTMPNLTSNSNIQYTNDNATKVIETDMAWVVNNSDGVNRLVLRYAGENGFITGNTLFGMEQSKVAERIGLTANKIVKGQTVLGITGTGTTGYSSCSSCCGSCPSCPSCSSCCPSCPSCPTLPQYAPIQVGKGGSSLDVISGKYYLIVVAPHKGMISGYGNGGWLEGAQYVTSTGAIKTINGSDYTSDGQIWKATSNKITAKSDVPGFQMVQITN